MQPQYVQNAPSVLIKYYERLGGSTSVPVTGQRAATWDKKGINSTTVLERLICHAGMKRVWKFFDEHASHDRFYLGFFDRIIAAMVEAPRSVLSQRDLRDKYKLIAKRAKQLEKLIAEPQGGSSLYRAELNLVSQVFGPDWHRFVECLQTLNRRAIETANEPLPPQKRHVRNQEDKRQTRAKLFVCYLDGEMVRLIHKLVPPKFTMAIASAVYDPDNQYLDRESLRQAIYAERLKCKVS
jgi:hypothetical protein